jgi:hypothetical protein
LDAQDLNAEADEEQAARYDGDPWDELIAAWVEGKQHVSVGEILSGCLEKPKAQWGQVDKSRVARSLKSAGWERFQLRTPGGREWRYRKG